MSDDKLMLLRFIYVERKIRIRIGKCSTVTNMINYCHFIFSVNIISPHCPNTSKNVAVSTLITNLMHWLLFIHKILFSSTCFEYQVLVFRRT